MQKQTCIITAALVLSLGLAHAQNGNEAKVRVKGEHNDHQITQRGTNETVLLTQGTSSQQTRNSTAKVTMYRQDNEVRIEQLNSWSDKASVESGGQRGTVLIQQRNSEANQAEVYQSYNGEASEAIIRQKQKGNVAQIIQSSNYQEAIIDQDGDRNKGYVQQALIRIDEFSTSSSPFAQQNKASLRQRGQDNTGVIAQKGAEGDVKVTQHGEDNFAYVYQGPEASTPIQNQAIVSQEGSLNQTSVYQSSNSNIADVVLVGTSNSSEIAQGGIIPATPPSVYPY